MGSLSLSALCSELRSDIWPGPLALDHSGKRTLLRRLAQHTVELHTEPLPQIRRGYQFDRCGTLRACTSRQLVHRYICISISGRWSCSFRASSYFLFCCELSQIQSTRKSYQFSGISTADCQLKLLRVYYFEAPGFQLEPASRQQCQTGFLWTASLETDELLCIVHHTYTDTYFAGYQPKNL